MKKLFLFCFVLLQGCLMFGQDIDYKESSVRYVEPSQFVFTTPVIADLDIAKEQIVYKEVEAFKIRIELPET